MTVALAGSELNTAFSAAPLAAQPVAAAISSQHAAAAAAPPAQAQAESAKPVHTELIRRAQLGDAAAFEELYHLYCRRVYALCFRMVGNSLDAEELTQEAFLQVFRKIQTFRGESAFTTWLHRLTFNAVLMRFRKKMPVTTSLDEFADQDDDSRSAPRDVASADLRLAGTLDRMLLQSAIDQLPPGYKAIFMLHDVQGYGHDEIAQILRCSIGNSKSQLHKARLKLRRLIVNAGKKSSTSKRRGRKPAFPRLTLAAAALPASGD